MINRMMTISIVISRWLDASPHPQPLSIPPNPPLKGGNGERGESSVETYCGASEKPEGNNLQRWGCNQPIKAHIGY